MGIAFRSAATGSADLATDVVVDQPAGLADGDVLVAFWAQNPDETFTPPSGFTLVEAITLGGQSLYQNVYTKAITDAAGEPATYTFSLGSPVDHVVCLLAYSGVDNTTPVDVDGAHFETFFSSIIAPSVTTTDAPGVLVRSFVIDGSTTVSPPTSTTWRAAVDDVPFVDVSMLVVDETFVATGDTGARNASSPVNGATLGYTVALVQANQPPNAPTLDSPASGATIDRANTLRLDWIFSDPDAGDSQSKYDVQLRPTGGANLVDATGTTPDTFHDLTGGTITVDGGHEWRVRTYDAQGLVGPWSSWSPFTAASQPATPTVTDPLDAGVVGTEDYVVAWSTPEQAAYQVRTVADAAGSPDTGTVYTDTGTVVSTVARSRSVTFVVNGRFEHVQVRIKADGLWSEWVSNRVDVDYTGPAVPIVSVTSNDPVAAISVSASHPTPTGSEPAVLTTDIHRRVTSDGGAGIRIAATSPPTAVHADHTVASGVDYEFRVRAYGDNTTSVFSAWTGGDPDDPTPGFYGGGGYA